MPIFFLAFLGGIRFFWMLDWIDENGKVDVVQFGFRLT
jgi:hypothetical protein